MTYKTYKNTVKLIFITGYEMESAHALFCEREKTELCFMK